MVEPGVAIIASSLATIRPLLRALKIRGFESTQRSKSTGFSSKKYAGGSMPGYGPNDVSLHRVTVVDSEARSPAVGYDEYHRHAAGMPSQQIPPFAYKDEILGNTVSIQGGAERRESDSKSEVYIIEGKRDSPRWGSRESQRSGRSTEDINALEAQPQEDTQGILGRGRRH